MHLVLVRHGETTWNALERLQGRADAPLSEQGREQVLDLAKHLVGFERVVRSPLCRAAETADLLGYADAAVDERWNELDLGAWTNCWLADLPPQQIAHWRAGDYVPPGGEQFADAVDRVGDAITALGASRTPTLVISHGGAIRAAVTWVTGLERGRLTPVRPASVTVLDVTGRTIITYGATTSLSSVLTRPSSDAL